MTEQRVPAGSSAYAAGSCIVIVGGRFGSGGRVCGHARERHRDVPEGGCADCFIAGVDRRTENGAVGVAHAGFDHRFLDGAMYRAATRGA